MLATSQELKNFLNVVSIIITPIGAENCRIMLYIGKKLQIYFYFYYYYYENSTSVLQNAGAVFII